MKWLRVVAARLRGLLWPEAVNQDIDEELRFHLEMETRTNIERGMTADEARRQAARSFGNMGRIKGLAHNVRGGGILETLWQDMRYGVRMFLKHPGFTAVAVLTLGLGIGANTAIFSVVSGVLLRALPYPEPERLVIPAPIRLAEPDNPFSISYADYLDWRRETGVFESVAAYMPGSAIVTGQGGPERIPVSAITEDYFAVMGARPRLGRTFSDEENRGGGTPVVVISYGLWQRRFGGEPDITGKPFTTTSRSFTIIGVMPPRSQYTQDGEEAQVWMPLSSFYLTLPSDFLRRDNGIFRGIARLKRGVSVAQADAQLAVIAGRVAAENPNIRRDFGMRVFPLQEQVVGKNLRRALLVLLGAVGFVLAVACANIASLLLARAAAREREIAIRVALGAGRWRVICQLLAESLWLGLAGGAAGLLLAWWGVDWLVSSAPADTPRLDEIGMDWRVLAFTLLVSLLTALATGLIPAWQASRTDVHEALKEGGRAAAGGQRGRRLRDALVVAEVAISVVLLVGGGLMLRSFYRLQQVDPGFSADGVLTFELVLPGRRYDDDEKRAAVYAQLTAALRGVPGVQSVAAVSALPLNGGGFYLGRSFLREGDAEPPAAPDYGGQWNVVSPDYFSTLGIGLVRGRFFTESDDAKHPPVVIINQTLARKMFPNDDPLGRRIKSWRDENVLREIVGVVRDVRYFSRDEEQMSLVYVPHRQNAWNLMTLTVRTAGDPSAMTGAVRQAVGAVDKDLPVARVQTLAQVVAASTARQRFSATLLGLFAAVALGLAAVGIYGVISYTVAQRTHEIGVRMALGAQSSDVLRLVLGQWMWLAIVGVGIGLVASVALTRALTSLLYGVSATDPLVFAGMALLILLVSLVASYIPARRATKVDPLIALRYE